MGVELADCSRSGLVSEIGARPLPYQELPLVKRDTLPLIMRVEKLTPAVSPSGRARATLAPPGKPGHSAVLKIGQVNTFRKFRAVGTNSKQNHFTVILQLS